MEQFPRHHQHKGEPTMVSTAPRNVLYNIDKQATFSESEFLKLKSTCYKTNDTYCQRERILTSVCLSLGLLKSKA